MEAYAIHKGAIIKPRLARMTMDLVRGKDVASARRILETTNTKASRLILKVLNLCNTSWLLYYLLSPFLSIPLYIKLK